MDTIISIKNWSSKVINTLEEVARKEQQFEAILEAAAKTNEILNLEQDFVSKHFSKVFNTLENKITCLIGNAPDWHVPHNYLILRRHQIINICTTSVEDTINEIISWVTALEKMDEATRIIVYKSRVAEDILTKLESIKFVLEQQKMLALKLFTL